MNLLAGCSMTCQDDAVEDGFGLPSDADEDLDQAFLLCSDPIVEGPKSNPLLIPSPVVFRGGG